MNEEHDSQAANRKTCPICGGKIRNLFADYHDYCATPFGISGAFFTEADIAPLRDYIRERLDEMFPRQTWRDRWADRFERWAKKLRVKERI